MNGHTKPFCPWCFDAHPYADASAQVEAGPSVGNPGRVISWSCKACCVSLGAEKWAKAMQWAAQVNGISAASIEAEVERATGGQT